MFVAPDQVDAIAAAARVFLDAALETLREDHVVPPPTFHPHLRVGRDYFGPDIAALAEFQQLEALLGQTFEERFREPLRREDADFVDGYIFSLLEACVTQCAVQDEPLASGSYAVEECISDLLKTLSSPECEVVCCRAMSHLTTVDRELVEIAGVTVIPEPVNGRVEDQIRDFIPHAGGAFNRERPFFYDPPPALLVGRAVGTNPFTVVEQVSGRISHFVLLMRLLFASTAVPYYEVRGENSLVRRYKPEQVDFLHPRRGLVRRTTRLSKDVEPAFTGLGEIFDGVEVNRERMIVTSFDIALHNFNRSYSFGGWDEQLVDLATALEAILSGKEKEDVTLRLKSRAAALLSTAADPARTIFDDVGELYALRSTLVHGGNLTERELNKRIRRISTVPEDTFGVGVGYAIDRMRDLVRRSILVRLCLATGEAPLWPASSEQPIDSLLADDSTRAQWRTAWHEKLTSIGAGWAGDPAWAAVDVFSQLDR